MNKKYVFIIFTLTNLSAFLLALGVNFLRSDQLDIRNENSIEDKKRIEKFTSNKSDRVVEEVLRIVLAADSNSSRKLFHLSKFKKLVTSMNEDELKSLIDALGGGRYEGKSAFELKMIMFKHWKELNPESLLDHIHNNERPEFWRLRSSTIVSWGLEDPSSALKWLRENKIPTEIATYVGCPSDMGYQIYNFLAASNKDLAFIEFSKEDRSGSSVTSLSTLAYTLSEPEEFQQLMKIAESKFQTKDIIGSVLGKWIVKDPDGAMAWVDSITDAQLKEEALSSITRSWIFKEPVKAANWVLENNSNSGKAFKDVVTYWPFQNTEGLVAWLEELPKSQNKNIALGQAINRELQKKAINQTTIVKALQSIDSDELRYAMTEKSYQAFYWQKGEKASQGFVNGLEISQQLKEQILKKPIPDEVPLILPNGFQYK